MLAWSPTPALPSSPPAGRLLLQRLRKSQSTTVLYGEPEGALEQLSLQDGGAGMFPQLDSGSQARPALVLGVLPMMFERFDASLVAMDAKNAAWVWPAGDILLQPEREGSQAHRQATVGVSSCC